MNKRRWILLIAMAGPGLLLQVLGAVRLFGPGTAELNLALGSILFLLGTIASSWATECCATAKGRSGAWALLAFLGPVGPATVVVLKDRSPSRAMAIQPMISDGERRSGRKRTVGVLATLLVTGGFLWTAALWVDVVRVPSPGEKYRDMLADEVKTWHWLRKIARAQERYRERDWDGDGKKVYALFLVHLWQSVDKENDPVAVRLIPRRLGFAMSASLSVDGYSYQSLACRRLPPGEIPPPEIDTTGDVPYGTRELDLAEEWAMVAFPAMQTEAKALSFLIRRSGAIHAKILDVPYLEAYPNDPRNSGWVEVVSLEELERLQKDLEKPRIPKPSGAPGSR